MMRLETLMWLFPMAFMIHDFEEIIFFPSWLTKNIDNIRAKYPRIAKMVQSRLGNLSSASFALAVFEEFIVLVVLTFVCVEYDFYSFYATLVAAYLFHVLVHVIQSIALQRYIPAVGSAVLTAIYCVYTLYVLDSIGYLNWQYIWRALPIVIIAMVLNLFFAHWVSAKYGVL
ncbi:MAG TPA: HXXEE domain-containing protein [Negativicutes bacterium]|nr:HXXEE domain-containing protein [Negativicutes bacterium]